MFAKLAAFLSGVTVTAKTFVFNFVVSHTRVVAAAVAAAHTYVTELATHVHNLIAEVMIHVHALVTPTPAAPAVVTEAAAPAAPAV